MSAPETKKGRPQAARFFSLARPCIWQWAVLMAPFSTRPERQAYTTRSSIIFFTSAMALAGFRPLGQTFAQFMMVWQR